MFGNELSDSIKKFTDKMQGHIRREFRYRAFAAHLLSQFSGLRGELYESGRVELDRLLETWKVELDDIAKL
jgi:hypothetical protein